MQSALKELNIAAKSTATLSDEDVRRVRAHVQGKNAGKDGNASVIVRRHRNKDAAASEAPSAETSAPKAEAAVESPAKAAPKAEKAAAVKAEKTAKVEKAETKADAKHAATGDDAPKKAPRKPKTKQIDAPPARIIRPAAAEAPVAEPIASPVKAEPAEKAEHTAPKAAPKTAPEAVKESAPKEVAKETVKEAVKETAPKAKAEAVAEAKAPVADNAAKDAAPKADATAPKADAPAPKPRYEVDMKAQAQEGSANGTTGANPANGDADGDRKKKKKKRREEFVAPAVRVISRPDPNAKPAPAPTPAPAPAGNAGGRPAGGAPRGDRPQGERRPYPPRDNRGGDRPYPPRDSDSRDRDSNRGSDRPSAPRSPRPAGGGGGRPPFGQAAPAAPFNEQSKKKRQKGRRTVEFGGEGDRVGGKRLHEEDGGNWSRGRKGGKRRPEAKPLGGTQPQKAVKRKIKVEEFIRVSDLAHQMSVKSPEIIKILMGLGIMATINQSLDIDTATVVASEFGYEVEKAGFSEADYLVPDEVDTPEMQKPRPPVVTIMGHVDHGKTSLLDAIRQTHVTSGEAGGITQHIGAYHVTTKRGDIVFLDTPGHEAFTAMRARGAQVTDLVILVVAADDGVMEQTREAVSHSKAAGVPIVVAVNKIDKEAANPERVMRELAELGLVPEAWGGDTIFAEVSAKTHLGLDDLLEMLALQAEVLELTANPDKFARGHIVEAKLDKGRGAMGTVLIQEGTLHQGDAFVCGVYSGRVRAMFNDAGKKAKEAGPSIPVEVQGFEGVPVAGEEFICVKDEKVARRIAEQRAMKQRERDLARESKVTLETFLAQRPTDAEVLNLNIVLKADVQGSVGAICDVLNKIHADKVKVNVMHSGAGAITESDILLASASRAIIIGFNVRPTAKVKEVAEQESVDIRFYDIIYKLEEEIKAAMAGMLAPVLTESYLGQAEVRQTFSVPKVGVIAGCSVVDGKMLRSCHARLLRNGVVIYTGKISSLKRMKDDAKEVAKGYECGIGLENFNDIKVGDVIETFEEKETAATLE